MTEDQKIYVLTVELRGTDSEIMEAVGALQYAAQQLSSTGHSTEVYDDDGLIVIEGRSVEGQGS